ncbi:MAG: UDP-N-acetylmuramoyl-L-alanyl-D-glutamate--2,6-diaminopimelate ligase [Ruminococcaceae bacterium]|nr:UDP-N-acetylmuramoyl-L-alanyl-D-glutamate--2,6-diaminopimelate ligase [Oscillospiraceae bacterium]
MLLDTLLSDIEVTEKIGDTQVEISGINYNSRKIRPGDVFVAVRGLRADGHDYIQSAIEAGAAAIVGEQETPGLSVPQVLVKDTRYALAMLAAAFYGYPGKKLRVIGVTGTNGKTTVTYLVKTILEHTGHKVGLIGTNQNMVGNMVLKSEHTTPESLELQELFSIMVREGVDSVVMEVSSHSLELGRVAGCHFAVGAFTNLTQDHLDFHLTMDNYMMAKARLFSMCDAGVFNADDSAAEKLMETATCKKVTYGTNKDCDIYADGAMLHARGVEFTLDGEKVRLAIPGEFSVYNALCAAGICMQLGIPVKDIAAALATASGVKGRAEVVDVPTPYTVMIDYAHSPDGLENILRTVRGFCKERLIVVFGCGGDRDRTKRPIMGRIAGELADFCVVTSDNPRSEEPAAIIREVMEGVKQTHATYEVVENRRKAIAYAMRIAREGDVVLLAGKGHETYQILHDGIIDFDERKIVREILDGKE